MSLLRHPLRNSPQAGFPERYGSWALIAGASEGLGAAYARALAARGMNLVLVARRRHLLDQTACEISAAHTVEVICRDGDLASVDFVQEVQAQCSGLDLGVVVYNAAHAPVGEFVSLGLEEMLRVVDVNVRAPSALLQGVLPAMVARGRGAVVLMTSLAGNQGAPRLAAYASSKAFARVLGESLWYELRGAGIDVLACCAGAVRTPGYGQAAGKDAPGTLDPEDVVESALRSLGRRPVVVPGLVNRLADIVMSRVLSRRLAIDIMAGNTGGLTPASVPQTTKEGS